MKELIDVEALMNDMSSIPIRAWVLGRPGSAKTSSLASLLQLELHVHLLSLDGNYQPLLLQVKRQCPDKIGYLDVVRLSQEYSLDQLAQHSIPTGTYLWSEMMKALNDWPGKCPLDDEGNRITHPNRWGAKNHVLVLDNLSPVSAAAISYVRQTNNLLRKPMDYKFWQVSHDMVYDLCEMLATLNTNLLFLSHVEYVDVPMGVNEAGVQLTRSMGFPDTVGKKLGGKIVGTYPTAFLYERDKGYKIHVKPVLGVDVKVPLPPEVLDREFTATSGLGDIFALMRGEAPRVSVAAMTLKVKK